MDDLTAFAFMTKGFDILVLVSDFNGLFEKVSTS